MFPKILIAAPTAKSKNYCFEEWLDNVMKFTYPNFEVVLFDNTQDGGVNAKALNKFYETKYGYDEKFKCINSLVLNKIGGKRMGSVIERMCMSHNDCRNHALTNDKFDYLLHLETDVIPQKDIIEQLLFQKKQVIGATYFVDNGKHRRPMIQLPILNENKVIGVHGLKQNQCAFLDGTVKQVFHVGLGCVLISKKVLNKIKFRYVENDSHHPDSYFARDCFSNNIPIFAHTGCIAKHENEEWGVYGLDFK